MRAGSEVFARIDDAIGFLVKRLGRPALGVVLGSGFAPLAVTLGAGTPLPAREIPGYPSVRAHGHGDGVGVADLAGRLLWVFFGRFHLYEGLSPESVVMPVSLLAAARAGSVLLTCAAGGLLPDDRPGRFAVVSDHLNLTGVDPVAALRRSDRSPVFPDLQDAYDARLRERWMEAAGLASVPAREGVLAGVRGPSFETPAEVRMLRALGAELATMSTVPEVIAARFYGLRVAAVACVANRGAGMDAKPIRHDRVLETVAAAVEAHAGFLRDGIAGMLEIAGSAPGPASGDDAN